MFDTERDLEPCKRATEEMVNDVITKLDKLGRIKGERAHGPICKTEGWRKANLRWVLSAGICLKDETQSEPA